MLISFQTVKAQVLTRSRSTLGVGGSSKFYTSNGHQYYLQQSIGQSSMIGLYQYNNYLLRQGFIQPLNRSSVITIPGETLTASVYPNPFTSDITVTIDEEEPEIFYVSISDMNGKIVYFEKYEAIREVKLNVGTLVPSIYILKVTTTKKCFYSKMIKF